MADRGDDVRDAELADRVEEIADSLEHGYDDYAVNVLRKAARHLRSGEGERLLDRQPCPSDGCIKENGHDGPCAEKVPPSIPGWPHQDWPNLP